MEREEGAKRDEGGSPRLSKEEQDLLQRIQRARLSEDRQSSRQQRREDSRTSSAQVLVSCNIMRKNLVDCNDTYLVGWSFSDRVSRVSGRAGRRPPEVPSGRGVGERRWR